MLRNILLETFKVFLTGVGYIILLISIIPLIRNDYWIFRVFEYPRIQKLIVNVLLLAVYVSLFQITTIHAIVFTALLFLNIAYLVFQVVPFTILGKKQLINLKSNVPNKQMGLFIGNVYQRGLI